MEDKDFAGWIWNAFVFVDLECICLWPAGWGLCLFHVCGARVCGACLTLGVQESLEVCFLNMSLATLS